MVTYWAELKIATIAEKILKENARGWLLTYKITNMIWIICGPMQSFKNLSIKFYSNNSYNSRPYSLKILIVKGKKIRKEKKMTAGWIK